MVGFFDVIRLQAQRDMSSLSYTVQQSSATPHSIRHIQTLGISTSNPALR